MRSRRDVDSRDSRDFRARSPPQKANDRYRRHGDNLSPRIAGSRRRSSSLEGRDHSRQYDGGRDYAVDAQTRMPAFGQVQDRSAYGEEVPPRRGPPAVDYRAKYGNLSPMKYAGLYECREKDVQVGSSSIRDERDVLVKKDLHFDDRAPRTLYAPMPDSRGGTFTTSSGNYSVGLHVDKEFRYEDTGRLDPLLARKYYGEEEKIPVRKYYGEEDKVPVRSYYSEEDKAVPYSTDGYYSRIPVSQSCAFDSTLSGLTKSDVPLTYRGNMTLPFDEFDDRNGRFSSSFRVDGYGRTSAFDISIEPKDLLSSERGVFSSSSRGDQWDNNHHEVGRSEKESHGYPSDEFYRTTLLDARGEYGDRDLSRPSYLGVDVDRFNDMKRSHKDLSKDGLSDQHLLQRESVPSYTDMKRTSFGAEKDVDFLGTGQRYLEFGAAISGNAETTHAKGSYGFGKDILNGSSIFESHLNAYRLNASPEQRLKAEELDMHSPSARAMKRKYVMEEDINDYRRKYAMEEDINDYKRKYAMEEDLNDYRRKYVVEEDLNDYRRKYVMEENFNDYRRKYVAEGDVNDYKRKYVMEEDLDGYSSKKAILNSRDIARRVREQNGSDEQRNSRIRGMLSSKGLKSGRLQFPKPGRTIEKMGSNRLKVWGADTEPHVLGSRKVSIKKRLNFASKHVHNINLGSRQNFRKPYKVWRRHLGDQHETESVQEDNTSVDWVRPTNPDPPEGSDEFKNLVHKAFLHYSKQLNENKAQRRKYKEHGNASSLLCLVCGSTSKEFTDTQALASHAFMCQKGGLRTNHLGLHKGLCVLMGWKSDAGPGGNWFPLSLPSTVASALREDLILWPPVVIVHNISIENPDRRQIVTVEEMTAILRDMGFSLGVTKVQRGKPANQSIMVVTFSFTFSGFQDAERLHKYFADEKRGREEFCGKIGGNSMEGRPEKLEHVLYGYMGIAEDFDKLDFGMKNKCSLKSKKNDIQAIADAPLKERDGPSTM
ncbi:hypothetical protein Sjap_001236 [Stephania japonica]|uniref:XS domain-containing protein n=1 Tax=Stephania japonica TaxID=461633 RepID=A0AAP0KJK7_9MAGN